MLGELLAERRPDAVVSSPLLRARETAEAIASAAGLQAAVDERLAPGADADDLRAAVSGRGETVITVGHQPDCSEIVLALTGREVQFPTAGFAEVEI
jgi:phosphohistidine phosphatase SixA